jgi:uncharacterized protein YqjF (DUF2071 family)
MDAEAVTPSPVRSVGHTVFTQTWAELSFLHWAVEPERLAPYLPRGVRADVVDGVSYVGLVPFRMRDIGAWGSPGVPYLGSFLETNVRLYSVDEQGRRGVVFVSLDASRLAPVLAARWGPGLPYLWSRMRYQRTGDLIEYRCRRRWPGPRGAASQIKVRVGEPIEAGPLEHFLTARWGLHLPANRRPRPARTSQVARGNRGTYYWPNSHPQWPLHAATLESIDDNLLAAAGFGDLTARPPDSVLFSPGVRVIFGPRQPA